LGIQYDLFGADGDVLKNVIYDLKNKRKKITTPDNMAANTPAAGQVARIYGENGVVRDPRTGASMPYNKQFWKGNLEDFLDAWMAMITISD